MLDRSITSFGLSIGTGLMFESLFKPTTDRIDETREVPEQIDVNKYNKHYINLYTLIRNIISSFSTNDRKNLLMRSDKVDLIMEIISEEAVIINSLYEGTGCEPIFYKPDYKKITKKIPDSYLNNLNKDIETLYVKVLEGVSSDDNMNYVLPKNIREDVLITTHFPIDLFNYKNFKSLSILESHTGKLKDRKDFNSKYKTFSSYNKNILPFTELILQILGDGHMFKGAKPSIKKRLYTVAMDNKWSPTTTKDRIRNTIAKDDAELYEYYKTLVTFF